MASLAGITFPQAGFFGPTLDVVESMPASPAMLLAYLEPRLLGGLAGQRLGDAALRLWDFARQHAPLLEATAQQRSLIHGDYKAENLLARRVDDSWALAGVLDWEFAWAGAPLFDVAIFLRHDRELDPAFRTEFARGYRASGGLLPAGWRQLARLLDLFNLCGFLDEPGERGTLVADVTRLLLATMDRWDEDALVE